MTTFISTQATGVPETVAATGAAAYAWLLILIPLASAGLLLLLGRVSDKWGHLLATLASWSTFAVGAAIAAQMWNSPVGARRFGETLFTWSPMPCMTEPAPRNMRALKKPWVKRWKIENAQPMGPRPAPSIM